VGKGALPQITSFKDKTPCTECTIIIEKWSYLARQGLVTSCAQAYIHFDTIAIMSSEILAIMLNFRARTQQIRESISNFIWLNSSATWFSIAPLDAWPGQQAPSLLADFQSI
jgi:hypothetical protein